MASATAQHSNCAIYCLFLVPIGISLSVFLFAQSQSAAAHSRVDQSSVGHASSAINIGAYPPMAQSFVPSSSGELDGVSLALMLNWGPAPITVSIKEASLYGPVLGSATRTLIPGSNPRRWEHFDFKPPIDLKAGATYLIEPATAARPGIEWFRNGAGLGELDLYPDGVGFIEGVSYFRDDFIFQTCMRGGGESCFKSGHRLWPEVIDRLTRTPKARPTPTGTPGDCIDFSNTTPCTPGPTSSEPTPTPCIDFNSNATCAPF